MARLPVYMYRKIAKAHDAGDENIKIAADLNLDIGTVGKYVSQYEIKKLEREEPAPKFPTQRKNPESENMVQPTREPTEFNDDDVYKGLAKQIKLETLKRTRDMMAPAGETTQKMAAPQQDSMNMKDMIQAMTMMKMADAMAPKQNNMTEMFQLMQLMNQNQKPNGSEGLDTFLKIYPLINGNNNKGAEMIEIFKLMALDKGKSKEMDWAQKMLEHQEKNNQVRLDYMQELAERDKRYFEDKITATLDKRAQKEGWSSEIKTKIEDLVLKDVMAKMEKGLIGEKDGADAILDSIGKVVQMAAPIIEPMIKARVERSAMQQQAQQPPAQNVRQAMEQQVQGQQQAPQREEPYLGIPITEYDEDYDFNRERKKPEGQP